MCDRWTPMEREFLRQKRCILIPYIQDLKCMSSNTQQHLPLLCLSSSRPVRSGISRSSKGACFQCTDYITVSHCITLELLHCCLLIADLAGCCWSRGLVWNTIIYSRGCFRLAHLWVFSRVRCSEMIYYTISTDGVLFFLSQRCEKNAVTVNM